MKVIITGATGMVGEGALYECLRNDNISEVLIISRRRYGMEHPKLRELIIPEFAELQKFANDIRGFDACFFCAGVSSVGMKEEQYSYITFDTTLAFAKALLAVNDKIKFCYVSGRSTDSSEKGNTMWARVKGKTENALMKLPFQAEYNFRPGFLLPFKGQKNWNKIYHLITIIMHFFAPGNILTMEEVGKAMINAVTRGYPANILEIADIKKLAADGMPCSEAVNKEMDSDSARL